MGIPLQKGTIETMLNVGKIYEIQCFEYKLQTERVFSVAWYKLEVFVLLS